MPFPERPPMPAGMDARLEPFLLAPTEASADEALTRLMTEASPLIVRCLQRKGRRAPGADTEDAASEARTCLIARLRRLREDNRQSGSALPAIGNFDAYVSAVAFTAWAGTARQRHPRRAALLNRLQYLLENRTNQRGFALWTTSDGERWAGFELWRGKAPDPASVARQGQLAADPHTAAQEAFGDKHAAESLNLAELVAGLFSWLGGPLKLRDLTDAIAEWQGISHPPESLPAEDHGQFTLSPALLDPRPSPHDELCWREYLTWLWQETARLTLRQRTAFLLHSTCLRELELLGLASVRLAAARLEISSERMAEYWNALPLEDHLIAAWLNIGNQQVINLRRVARDILGRAWHLWLHQK